MLSSPQHIRTQQYPPFVEMVRRLTASRITYKSYPCTSTYHKYSTGAAAGNHAFGEQDYFYFHGGTGLSCRCVKIYDMVLC